MINCQFYKLFNKDLKNLNNIQLQYHWKNIGIKENRICSLEHFYSLYPYFDNESYKKYNSDIHIIDKLELMIHWHNIGNKENKLCSDMHFNYLYPNIDINKLNKNDIDIIEFRKQYHINKLNNIDITIENLEKDNSEKISEEVNLEKENSEEVNVEKENLEEINLEEVNLKKITYTIKNIDLCIFCNKNNFLKNIYNYLLLNNKYDKIIIYTEKSINISLQTTKNIQIFYVSLLSNNTINYIIKYFDIKKLTLFINFNQVLNNNELEKYFDKLNIDIEKTSFDKKKPNSYFYKNIFKSNFREIIDNDYIFQIIKYGINIYKKNIFIYFTNENYNNFFIKTISKISLFDYNIFVYIGSDNINIKNTFLKSISYIKIDDIDFIKYSNYIISDDVNIINDNLNSEKIFIPFYYNNNLTKYNNKIIYIDDLINNDKINNDILNNFTINEYTIINNTIVLEYKKIDFFVILIVDKNDNYNIINHNINILLDQNYFNYTILLYFNNIDYIDIKQYINKKIYLYKSFIEISKIDILYFFSKLCNKNSYFIVVDNKNIIDYEFSLNNLSNYLLINNIFVSDKGYDNFNLFIIKNEILIDLVSYFINNTYTNKYDDCYINCLCYVLKNNYNINSDLKNEYAIIFEELSILYDKYLIESRTYNNYLINNFDSFSNEKIIILSENKKIYELMNNILFYNKNTEKYSNINKLDYLSYSKKINNYNYLDYIIYLYEKERINYYYYINRLYVEINNKNSNTNIILYINDESDHNEIYNYILKFENNCEQINIIETNYYKKFYNFIKTQNYILFSKINYYYLEYDKDTIKYIDNNGFYYNLIIKYFELYLFNYENIMIDNIKIDRLELKEFGLFDAELFVDKNHLFKLYNYKKNNIIDDNNNDIYIKDIINIYSKKNELPLYYTYLKYRDIIDLKICDKIKTVVINLDDRDDRLDIIERELNKHSFYNYERFSAIKLNEINNDIIDENKAWKKNNNEYLLYATGCKMSHLEVLNKYKDINEDYLLIIEDDVIFEKNVLIYLNIALYQLKNIEWDILYLTTNLKNQEDAIKINTNLLKIINGYTTTAQIFKTKNIPNILKKIESSKVEIDNTYNDYLNEKYCIYPMCCYQNSSYSNINKIITDYGNFHRKFIY